jgi:excisionase family DNA binding protein
MVTPNREGHYGWVISENWAERLACSEATPRRIHQGKLPCVKAGRLTRIRQQDLEAWVRLGLTPRWA